MKEYREYKQWWIDNQAPQLVDSLYYGHNSEEAFKQHIKDLGLYKLMETLAVWSNEE
jgi:hypothetical protein